MPSRRRTLRTLLGCAALTLAAVSLTGCHSYHVGYSSGYHRSHDYHLGSYGHSYKHHGHKGYSRKGYGRRGHHGHRGHHRGHGGRHGGRHCDY